MNGESPRVVVVGSINMDLVIDCDRLPSPGETTIARRATESPGGKGANQAVAAARLGGRVAMVGRVGDDAFADRLVENLTREGVDGTFIKRHPDVASGLAIVSVEKGGENAITLVPGANALLSVDDIRAAAELIRSSDVLLVQLEIPIECVVAASTIAREAGVRIILDPAPAPSSFPKELLDVDVICPNQTEAAALLQGDTGTVGSGEEGERAARLLLERGPTNVIVTLGGDGSIVVHEEDVCRIAPFAVEVVDTTAAGDAFAAALAVSWDGECSLTEAARFASAAGAIAASRPGAQPAMPRRSDVERLMGKTDALPFS
ncbi:Ribokinase [Planctomycetes bacterium Pan216]|uniref:Ribokinase n=1 Tax=Kolteria novifilia TaxID=2527975 RepID=A0A518B5G1_9BACT|nr:Ribokinase [Planctomycetes bacterium Pan216]